MQKKRLKCLGGWRLCIDLCLTSYRMKRYDFQTESVFLLQESLRNRHKGEFIFKVPFSLSWMVWTKLLALQTEDSDRTVTKAVASLRAQLCFLWLQKSHSEALGVSTQHGGWRCAWSQEGWERGLTLPPVVSGALCCCLLFCRSVASDSLRPCGL